jgi:hypothetical protein
MQNVAILTQLNYDITSSLNLTSVILAAYYALFYKAEEVKKEAKA